LELELPWLLANSSIPGFPQEYFRSMGSRPSSSPGRRLHTAWFGLCLRSASHGPTPIQSLGRFLRDTDRNSTAYYLSTPVLTRASQNTDTTPFPECAPYGCFTETFLQQGVHHSSTVVTRWHSTQVARPRSLLCKATAVTLFVVKAGSLALETLSSGSLGSDLDEERSDGRYLCRTAENSEAQNFECK
jgi:hypothetical protein